MTSISNVVEKKLGGTGSILVLFTAVPKAGRILETAGFVMTPAAIKNISPLGNDGKILMGVRINA